MTAAIDLDSLKQRAVPFARNSSTENSPQLRHLIAGAFTMDASETFTVNG